MSLVLDSSCTLSWFLPGQFTDQLQQLLVEVETQGAWVPALWHFEVANSLQTGVRAGRITAAFRESTIADLEVFPIDTDPLSERFAWSATTRLAEKYGLTVYDASYLELALRKRLPLATLDQQLRAAAAAEGVTLLGL